MRKWLLSIYTSLWRLLTSPKLLHEAEQVVRAYVAAFVATGVLTSAALSADTVRAALVAALYALVRQIPALFEAP